MKTTIATIKREAIALRDDGATLRAWLLENLADVAPLLAMNLRTAQEQLARVPDIHLPRNVEAWCKDAAKRAKIAKGLAKEDAFGQHAAIVAMHAATYDASASDATCVRSVTIPIDALRALLDATRDPFLRFVAGEEDEKRPRYGASYYVRNPNHDCIVDVDRVRALLRSRRDVRSIRFEAQLGAGSYEDNRGYFKRPPIQRNVWTLTITCGEHCRMRFASTHADADRESRYAPIVDVAGARAALLAGPIATITIGRKEAA